MNFSSLTEFMLSSIEGLKSGSGMTKAVLLYRKHKEDSVPSTEFILSEAEGLGIDDIPSFTGAYTDFIERIINQA